MFCHKCGKEIEDGSAFCLYCGTKMPQNYSQDNPVNSDGSNSFTSDDKNCVVSSDKSEDNLCEPIKVEKTRANDNTPKSFPNSFSIPKFYHDVNINLGKSTILCIIGILVVVLISVCILRCDASSSDASNISSNMLLDSSDEVTTPDSYENEVERWDAENCIYSNFKYGVAFTLPKEMVWHKISGTSKHTVVKFVQPDTQLMLFVNINPIEGSPKVTDIWDVYEEFTNTYLQMVKSTVNHNSAEQIEDLNYKKAEFCGKHAIKLRYTSILGDDRHVEKKRLTTIDYTFFYNNTTTTVTVKCYDEIIEIFKSQDITMEDFLKSFQLIPIS
jgi:hypothetical protein